jgi:large subunit ribosomal protein L25
VGSKATKALRNAGQVPCVVYGGEKPLHFSAHELAFKSLVYTSSAHTVEIELGGQKINAILKDIQFHPVTDRILHVDFYQIFEDKEVTMLLPVHFVGASKGVLNGGVLRKTSRKLRVKAVPANFPDFLEADITELKIGNKLYVAALASDAFTIMHPENTVVCQVRTSRNAVEEEEEGAEAPAEAAAEAAAE